MPAPPLRAGVSGTPSRATANTAFGALWDYVTGLLGATGNAPEARAALGAAASGAATASGITMATARVLGRTTAATGAIEELTAAQVAAFTAAASTTAQGAVELATDAEAQTGTDATRAVTPDNLGATVLGMGQTWAVYTGSRALTTIYTNSTGRSIQVCISADCSALGASYLFVGGVLVSAFQAGSGSTMIVSHSIVVPPGATYQLTNSPIVTWCELR